MSGRNIIALNSMIASFGKRVYVSKVGKSFDQLSKKESISRSALISCCEQNQMYEEVSIIFLTT